MKAKHMVICMAVLLIAAGCQDQSAVRVFDLNGNDVEAPRDCSTPVNVIENIALAYRLGDLALYEDQLAPGFSVRFFEPMKHEDGRVVRGLTYEQNLHSVSAMFADARSLTFEMKYEEPVPSEFGDYPGSEDYVQINIHEFNLQIDSRERDTVLSVSNGQTVYVLKDLGTPERPDWKLVLEETH